MYRILIVDDEKVEREGIRFLIEGNRLNLDVSEAENGTKALEFIQLNRVDILFTDIKMPFMDGLELAEKVRRMDPDVKIVIYSAYGEFEYACKAIRSNVFDYVLKPIKISKFLELMRRLIKKCDDEQELKKKSGVIYKGYMSDRERQKNRTIYDLLSEGNCETQITVKLQESGMNLIGYITQMLVNVQEKLFDVNGDAFEKLLDELVPVKKEFLNINEYQILVFLHGFDSLPDRKLLDDIGHKAIQLIQDNFSRVAHVVFGNPIEKPELMPAEFARIEQTLEYRFYYEDGAVLFAELEREWEGVYQITEKMLSDILKSLENKDFRFALETTKKLFFEYKLAVNCSPVYIKYQTARLFDTIQSLRHTEDHSAFVAMLEKIYHSKDIVSLKNLAMESISSLDKEGKAESPEAVKRVVHDVVEIITNEYGRDLSLEYLSKKVYLTPSYVSFLFKSEVGMTPIKYITQFRLDKACGMLKESNKKISDISADCGFSNVSYFCMLFRNRFGVSPARFREECAVL